MESNVSSVQRLAMRFENLAAAQTVNAVKPQKRNWVLDNAQKNSTYDNVRPLFNRSITDENKAVIVEQADDTKGAQNQNEEDEEYDSFDDDIYSDEEYAEEDNCNEVKFRKTNRPSVDEISKAVIVEQADDTKGAQNQNEEDEEYDSFDDDFFSDEEYAEEDNCNEVEFRNTNRPSVDEISTNKVENIIQELYETEQSFVNTLTKGIEDYLPVFNSPNLPNSLRGQRNKIFGIIERIRDFHQNKFYPSLLQCNGNLEQICQQFCKYIQEDYFYVYVQYAINKHTSDKICEINGDFFKQHQRKIKDKLGISSILVQPIQRLPRYKLLLISLFNELVKQMQTDNVKEKISCCCKAEKCIDRLLELFNESMSISDIVECNDINISHQGKLYKVTNFDIIDNTTSLPSRRFNGRVFLFEKCVVFTETFGDRLKFQYRGYIPHANSNFEYKEGKSKFKLRALHRIEQQIVFMASFNVIQEWVKLITHFKMQSLESEKRKSAEKVLRRSESIRPSPRRTNIPQRDNNRGSDTSWPSSSRTSSGSGGSDYNTLGH